MARISSLALGALFVLVASGVALIPASGGAQGGTTHTVVVIVAGLRNDRGQVVGGLYERPESWLGDDTASQNCHATIRGGRARCVFRGVSSATVAFAALHDEDHDDELDRDLIGIPTEGYAFSNDVRDTLGPPSFEAASFSPARAAPLVVHVRYGI